MFAVVKAHTKKSFLDRANQNLFLRGGKQDAVADLITAWEFMGLCIIQKEWEIYISCSSSKGKRLFQNGRKSENVGLERCANDGKIVSLLYEEL
jgi:hypothetical protein